MFDNLTDRLSRTLRNISGRGRLTEDNVKDTLREVRMALLEADVALPVVREFINRVKEKAVGHEVNKSLTPGQEFVKIVRNELVAAMGEENQTLNLADSSLSEEALIQAMVDNPKLMERPIVVANGKARIGRPPEQVLEIVG